MFPHLFQGLNISKFHCETCKLAKHTRVSFPISNKRSSHPFHLIHSDIWGPSTIPNVSGARWFVSLIDDCTWVTWIFLLKQKSDVSIVIPNFHSMVQNQFGVKIKSFRTDNARDYFNQTLSPYFQSQGILHDSSCVNTPQQNGVAERKNGHLLNTTRALLFQGNVPNPVEILKSFYTHFRTSNGLTPRVFGCTAFVHVHSQHRDKLDPRAIKCVLLSYSSTQKGYKCYNPLARKFYISANVTFIENKPFFPKSSLQGEISIMEDSPYESFEPLDLPHASTHGDEEPESSKSITPKSPNFTTKPMSSPVPASVTCNFHRFLRCIQGKKPFQNKSRSKNPTKTLGMKSR
ncbi:hypothetical protein PVL29_027317 [Vitis rotundifolia]|uniref:Integrase catalytic domain-containing protein n=1 Tax=Vitis rotundifolia TaxID=103349 RepID=A0AA38YIX1_VITRO|nr:hypothetical protein PVL29_027317 [Vitis rotundifolia]